MQARPSARATACLLALLSVFLIAGRRPTNVLPATGSQLFLGPKANPIALSNDGTLVYALNSSAGTLTIRSAAAPYTKFADVPVGLEPVGLAVRPKVNPADPNEDELVLVANHVSDSIAVVSRNATSVVDVIQTLGADDVSTSDEPTGIAFAGPNRAFVTLDHRNEILELTMGGDGRFVTGARTLLAGQGPRALAVANGRLYVAVAESGNQTEFPSCGASQPVNFQRGNPVDEGCLFPMNQGTLLQFASSPNMGGEVIRDTHIPDRDLFVFDLNNLASPIQVVTGVGTILNGVAVSGSRVFVTNTEARNDRDGLIALGNRMFENRLSYVDCSPTCGAVTRVDLEANAFGVPVPVPYGIAASADGATLVVTASNSDGVAGIPSNPGLSIPGLVTLSSTGTVLGRVVTGALPEGVALRSDASGAAQTAFVLNSGSSTMSVVDVSNPASPAVVATLPIGVDPAPPEVQRGRILFSAARASTSGTFSCESCHPQGHVDQLLWVINTLEGQNRNAHAHGLDHHLGGETAGGVEDLVVRGHAMLEHVARDLVDGVVAADVLHVEERPVLLRQHAAVDRAGFEIKRGRGVDLVRERVEPRRAQLRFRQRDVLQRLHQVAEHRALGAARGLHLLLQLFLVVGLALGAHHDDRQLLVVVDAGYHVVGQQHVLVEQVAEGKILRIVVDRHRGHDLLRIEEDRERALDRHAGLDRLPGLVDAGDTLGEPRVERIGTDQVVLRLRHGDLISRGRRYSKPKLLKRALPAGLVRNARNARAGSTAAPLGIAPL